MATTGFESAIFTIGDEEIIVDAKKGGAIEASITGLEAVSNTTYASNQPFFIIQKGVSKPAVELKIADLLDNGLYSKLIGAEEIGGFTALGANTEPPYVSLVLVTSTKEGKRMFAGLAKGKFSAPDVSMKTSDDNGQELQTDTIKGNFICDDRGLAFFTGVEDETTESTLDAFKKLVNGTSTTPA